MSNFAINFTIPWLLLLLIPAVVLTLWPYFKLAKRYRRTRNRIISIVLHLCIMLMCVSILSGLTFTYDIPNEDNEVILVVDMSYSGIEVMNSDVPEASALKFAKKDQFVTDVITESDGIFKVGVVAFGYKPVTVVESSFDTEAVIEGYYAFRDAEDLAEENGEPKQIDDSASDIAAALDYAANMLGHKEGSKLVLISDGIETDGNALSTVKRLAAEGIKIDTVSFEDETEDYDFQIIDVSIPEENYGIGDTVPITLTVESNIKGEISVTVYDTDAALSNATDEDSYFKTFSDLDIDEGMNEIKLNYQFNQMGMHRLQFTIAGDAENELADTVLQNNEYYTYMMLEIFDKVLILEGYAGEATAIKTVLENSGSYDETDIKVVNINPEDGDFENVPKSMDELRQYDQVILVNVANSDLINNNELVVTPDYDVTLEDEYMPSWYDMNTNIVTYFSDLLNDYVEVYGGGMFVVGGNDPSSTAENPIPHAFNRADLGVKTASAFTDMLPIDVVEYTPPIGVVIVIDRSGSMGYQYGTTNKTKLEYAKTAAEACLQSLTYRDYMGVLTLDSSYSQISSITSVNNRSKILADISTIEAGGGTYFSGAIQHAGSLLAALSDKVVSKRHVVVISDGEPQDAATGEGSYGEIMNSYYNSASNISFSIMHIDEVNADTMRNVFTEYGGGSYIEVRSSQATDIASIMKEELKNNAIQEFDPVEEFVPSVEKPGSNVLRDVQNMYNLPSMMGYYGTRAKEESEVILMAPYVPLYSQWKFGKGSVGAFMTSLNGGNSSNAFLSSVDGQTIVRNIVNGLMPAKNIRPKDIEVMLAEENYTTRVSVSTNIEEGQRVRVTVTPIDDEGNEDLIPQVVELSEADGFSRANIVVTQPGVHRVVVEKYIPADEDGEDTIVSNTTVYKTFSYSKEYEVFVNKEEVAEFMGELAVSGRGSIINVNSAESVFIDFDTGIHKEYDPRTLFMILSIVLFLLDIAVRKFKFKWIHEIIRDSKERKRLGK